jgi:NADH-quinone oxidoreductase subunit H
MDFVNSDIWQDLFVRPGNTIPVWAEVVRSVLRLVIGVLGALGSVPVLVWGERRLLALAQGRLGPNRVGPFGLLQPLADALKLMLKEDITPTNVDKTLYYIAPIVALVPVIMSVTVLPWNSSNDWGSVAPGLNIGILFLLAVASIEVYGVILAWLVVEQQVFSARRASGGVAGDLLRTGAGTGSYLRGADDRFARDAGHRSRVR